MAGLLEIIVKAKDLASSVISGVGDVAGETVDEIEGSWSKLSGIGKAAGIAAGAAMVAGIGIGMERESVTDKLAAQLRLTEEESAKAGDIAGTLYGQAYGASFEEITGVVGQVLGTFEDMTDETVERVAIKASDLNTAFDITDAVDRAGILLETGLATDVDHAMDLITASMQEMSPALREELGEATTEYSKFFSDLGFTGEETFAVLASADDKFELDKMGDAVKEFTIRATDMSTGSVAAFDTIGLSAEDMSAKLLGGGDEAQDAFQEIVDGLLAIEDPVERANASIALFGTPLEDLGVNEIPAFLGDLSDLGGGLQDVEGRADELGDTLNDNAKTKIETFRRSFENVLAKVVELPGPLGDVAAFGAAAGGALAPMAPMLAILATSTGFMTTVTGGLSKAMAFLAANPIILIIAGIIALVAGFIWLWNNVEGFRAFFLHAWEMIKSGFEIAWAAIQTAITFAWEKVIQPIWEAIKLGIDLLIMAIKIYLDIWKAVFRAIGDAVKWVWNNVLKPTWDSIKGGIDKLKEGIETFKGAWSTAWDGIKAAVRGPANGIIGFINAVLRGVEKLVNGIGSAINKIPDFTVPSWVPGIGGKTFGLPHIPTVSLPRIPSLAGGGIALATPGGFLARIGEGGRNERVSPIGGPDDPMVQIKTLLESIDRKLSQARTLSVDGRELANAIGFPLVEELRSQAGI